MALRRWESIAGNLVSTTELKRKLATVKAKKADVSSVSPSSIKGLTLETFSIQLLTLNYLVFPIVFCNKVNQYFCNEVSEIVLLLFFFFFSETSFSQFE